jgi:hypothetical protein
MNDPTSHSPRRYVLDDNGRRVLFGLTAEETSEFERLEASLALLHGEGGGADQPVSLPEQRWLELYGKHDGAWMRWMADLRANRNTNLPALN